MTLASRAWWSAAVAILLAIPAGAQTAKLPDIPPVGLVWTYAGTLRTAVAEKPPTEQPYRSPRRVIETGPDWFKIEFDMPYQDEKIRSVEKRSADPFAPAISSEYVLLTAAGERVDPSAPPKIGEHSAGAATGSLFPLEIGKAAQYPFVSVAGGREVPGVRDCKVASHGPVTVPLGTYDAFTVRCTATAESGSGLHADVALVYRYAAELGAVVSFESRVTVSRIAEKQMVLERSATAELAQVEKPSPSR